MMQGFFMSSTVNTNIVFYCEDRIATDNPGVFYRKSASTDPLIRLQAGGFGYTTESVVRFKTDATEGYDQTVDALLFPSGDPKGMDFGTLSSDDRQLVINTVPMEVMNTRIPLHLKIGTEGSYEIEMTDIKHFSSTVDVLLHDDELGVLHSLRDGPYNFASEITTGEGRFYIQTTDIVLGLDKASVGQGFILTAAGDQVRIQFEKPLLENRTIKVHDQVGRIVYTQVLIKGNDNFFTPRGVLRNNSIYFVQVEGVAKAHKVLIH